MATIISHAVGALTIAVCFPPGLLSRKVIVTGMILSMLPDADVLAFNFGIAYESAFGHRGFTHSLLFALLCAGILGFNFRNNRSPWPICLFFFLSMISHGLLDAMTTGGRGVGFFIPFDMTRYFFPYRPILVSPIGITEFLGSAGMAVIKSEIKFIWIPCLMLIVLVKLFTRLKTNTTIT